MYAHTKKSDHTNNKPSVETVRNRSSVASAFCAGDPMETVTMGSSPGRARVKDRSSVLVSQHLRRLVSACLAFVCTAHTKIVAHVKDPMPTFCHGNTHITHNSSRIMKIITVATPNERKKQKCYLLLDYYCLPLFCPLLYFCPRLGFFFFF